LVNQINQCVPNYLPPLHHEITLVVLVGIAVLLAPAITVKIAAPAATAKVEVVVLVATERAAIEALVAIAVPLLTALVVAPGSLVPSANVRANR